MSIVLSVLGNHKLAFDSYESAIGKIENLFNTEIIDYQEGIEIPEQTTSIDQLRFWTNHAFYKIKFEEMENWFFEKIKK